MSERINHFTESLRLNLTALEDQLTAVKADLAASRQEDAAIVRSKLDTARKALEFRKAQAQTAQGKAQAWLKAKEEAGAATLRGWKEKHEKNKLERHAERAEDNAESAIFFAELAMADAAIAVFEALEARLAADDVKSV